MIKLSLAATLLATLVLPAQAQQPPATPIPATPMPRMPMPATQDPAASPAAQAFKRADDKMMAGMNQPPTGNPDRDFVANMLPHHIGAVDMARVELQYGKDPELRRLARAIVAAQDKEIAQMRTWQRRHPAP